MLDRNFGHGAGSRSRGSGLCVSYPTYIYPVVILITYQKIQMNACRKYMQNKNSTQSCEHTGNWTYMCSTGVCRSPQVPGFRKTALLFTLSHSEAFPKNYQTSVFTQKITVLSLNPGRLKFKHKRIKLLCL